MLVIPMSFACGGGGSSGATGGVGGTGSGGGGRDGSVDAAVDGPEAEPDAAPAPDLGPDVPPICSFGTAGSTATANDLSVFGTPIYFNDGEPIAPGMYVITYLDGCIKYGGGQGWTVNAYGQGGCCNWQLVGETTADRKGVLPGTVGYAVGAGAFAEFEECVTASKDVEPLLYQHAGGKLGVWLQDSPYSDNSAGQDGRNPKWSMHQMGMCADAGVPDPDGGATVE